MQRATCSRRARNGSRDMRRDSSITTTPSPPRASPPAGRCSMPIRSAIALLALLASGAAVAAEPARSPMLGRAATSAEVEAADISIGPDGAGLPPGQGSVAQGKEVFAQVCQLCHNEAGKGQPADRLTG